MQLKTERMQKREMLEFTFLGANGSVQEIDSPNTSIMFGDGEHYVLVDVSANLALPVKKDVDAVIITHEHIDHMYGLPSLLHQMWISKRQKSLKIICPDGIREKVNMLIDGFSLRQKKGIYNIEIESVRDMNIGNMEFSFFKTVHTDNSVGLMVKVGQNKLVYTCDTAPIDILPKQMFEPDILIHETNSLAFVRKPDHSSGLDAGTLAGKIKAKKLIICHLPAENDEKEKILTETKTIFENTELPVVLKTVFLG